MAKLDNPEICLSTTDERERKGLPPYEAYFARWDTGLFMLPEQELASTLGTVRAFMQGESDRAQILLRQGNEQLNQQMKLVGWDAIEVDGVKRAAIHIHSRWVRAGDAGRNTPERDNWIERDTNILPRVKLDGIGTQSGRNSWQAIHYRREVELER